MNPYMNCWASVMNIVKRFSEQNPNYALTVMDFDANVEENEYPEGNIAGVYQLEYSESGPLIYIQLAFPVSISSDSDITSLNEMTGKLAAFVRNETKHPYYIHPTNSPVGLMTGRDELAVSPLVKTVNRQFKFVAQGFVVDRTATFQPV